MRIYIKYALLIIVSFITLYKFLDYITSNNTYELKIISDEPEILYDKIPKNDGTYIVNFFASWCASCLKEHPMLLTIKSNTNIPIYGVPVADKRLNVVDVLNIRGNPYDQLLYNFKSIDLKDLNLETLPKTIIVKDRKVILILNSPITSTIFKDQILPILNIISKEQANKNSTKKYL